MKYIEGFAENNQGATLELTRRNLTTLLAKLDDPLSVRTLLSPCGKIYVKAVEDDRHYGDREPGEMYMPSADVTI
jgi:hypothetical protein